MSFASTVLVDLHALTLSPLTSHMLDPDTAKEAFDRVSNQPCGVFALVEEVSEEVEYPTRRAASYRTILLRIPCSVDTSASNASKNQFMSVYIVLYDSQVRATMHMQL
jgi:hypothetical protein